MFSKNLEAKIEEDLSGNSWCQETAELLRQQYKNPWFGAYLYLYPEEIVCVFSLDTPTDLPTTLIMSLERDKINKKILETFIDFGGNFFDHYLNETREEQLEYFSDWASEQFQSFFIFFKVTRESPRATIQAENLLKLKGQS